MVRNEKTFENREMASLPAGKSQLTLALSGVFSARDSAGREVPGLSRRGQALLAYLSQQPSLRAERARLADLLWSERSEEQARASLRQELSVLRRALPEGVLDANRQLVWLDPDAVSVDTSGSGRFLDGFDLASEGFEDWLREIRQMEPVHSAVPAPTAAPVSSRNRPRLAVLPFGEIGANDSDMFADGVVEEITGALSRGHDFHVIARQSAFALRSEDLDAPATAKRLGADYLVEGNVRRAGERVRISVQLVRGVDGQSIWTERFDDRLDDLFELQDRIAAQVAGKLSPNLRAAEISRARTTPPENRNAYELVLTALPHMWAHRPEENVRALELLDQALTISPDYSPALAYKGWVLGQQPSYLWSDDPLADKANAMDLALRAARNAGDHAPTLVAIGAAIGLVSSDLDLSESFIDRALAIDPNNAWGWMRRGWNRQYKGRTDEARGCFDRAESLSPLDPFRFNMVIGRGATYMQDKKYELALEHFYRGLALSPEVAWAYRIIARSYHFLGRQHEAEQAFKKLMAAYPRLTIKLYVDSIPPSLLETQPEAIDALRRLGMPEE